MNKTLQELISYVEKLEQENETLLLCFEFTLAAVELWAKQQGFIASSVGSEEDFKKEISDRKNQIRTLFHNIIKTSEPGFIDGLLGTLNFPEDIKHLIKSLLVR